MEEVALARFSDGNGLQAASRLPRLLPLLAWVAVTNVQMWPEWAGCCARGGPPMQRGSARVHERRPHGLAGPRTRRERRPPSNDDVTIVITCFNYGRFLPEAVQSALDQEGGEPHVAVVDDGSTDEPTLLELERLPERVELIRQANAGVAAARNTGLRRVQTEYALALDADDRLPA